MNTILHRADTRGVGEYGWLSTRYSFSFADWYEPTRLGFGALRVLNDDTIAPSSGFPMHGHKDMEIITIVTRGTLTHKDSLGNTGIVRAGDVQVMSAGTGIVHSEYNASSTEPLSLFQIWIETGARGTAPRYEQKTFARASAKDGFVPLVGPMGKGQPLSINQAAYISRARIDAMRPLTYRLRQEGDGVYLFLIDGVLEAAGARLGARDALAISGADEVPLSTTSEADVLCIEIPVTETP